MKKLVECPNWKEYQGLNGWVMFCEAAAYNMKLTAGELEVKGCSDIKKKLYPKLMNFNIGDNLTVAAEIAETAETKRELVYN